jgi:predicted Zn-dependent peptidase
LKGVFVLQTATQAGLSNTLGNVYIFGLPADYLETFRARVSDVTPERVKAAAATLLGSEHSVIVIVGDYPRVASQLRPYGPVAFVDSEGRPSQPPPAAR